MKEKEVFFAKQGFVSTITYMSYGEECKASRKCFTLLDVYNLVKEYIEKDDFGVIRLSILDWYWYFQDADKPIIAGNSLKDIDEYIRENEIKELSLNDEYYNLDNVHCRFYHVKNGQYLTVMSSELIVDME